MDSKKATILYYIQNKEYCQSHYFFFFEFLTWKSAFFPLLFRNNEKELFPYTLFIIFIMPEWLELKKYNFVNLYHTK